MATSNSSATTALKLDAVQLDGVLPRLVGSNPALRLVRDVGERRIRLRLLECKRRGSWEVWNGDAWRKVATWPRTQFAEVLRDLPLYLQRHDRKKPGYLQPATAQPSMVTAGDLLDWYRARHWRSRQVGKLRKETVRQHIDRWLMPLLGPVRFDQLDKAEIDRRLIQPMLTAPRRNKGVCTNDPRLYAVAPATASAIYRTWLAALGAARRLNLLTVDRLADASWSSFGVKVLPKVARLFPEDLQWLLESLPPGPGPHYKARTLALLMLLHGTRLTETRLARWSDFDLRRGLWVIPAEHAKTKARHVIPLTVQAVALLQQFKAWQLATAGERVHLFMGHGRRPMGHRGAGSALAKLSRGEWSSHDLRKVARACWVRLGVDYLVGEALLNHALPGLAQVYAQTGLEQLKREALELWHGPGNARLRALWLVVDDQGGVHRGGL